MMEFNDDWINEYEKTQTLKVFYFYVNSEDILHKVNQEIIEVKHGIISRDELLKIIVKNRKKHKLTNVLSYIVPEIDDPENTNYRNFLTSHKLEPISLRNSPSVFESTNNLFFVFKEEELSNCKKLKQNTTKKVFINHSRHTRRKRLKANQTTQ